VVDLISKFFLSLWSEKMEIKLTVSQDFSEKKIMNNE